MHSLPCCHRTPGPDQLHIVAPLLFPWFEMAQNWITVVSHAVYGVVLAWAYVALARRAAYG
jgi:uncharacterized membrane protein YagU involved in acid resistance